jgi:hypothetical protein
VFAAAKKPNAPERAGLVLSVLDAATSKIKHYCTFRVAFALDAWDVAFSSVRNQFVWSPDVDLLCYTHHLESVARQPLGNRRITTVVVFSTHVTAISCTTHGLSELLPHHLMYIHIRSAERRFKPNQTTRVTKTLYVQTPNDGSSDNEVGFAHRFPSAYAADNIRFENDLFRTRTLAWKTRSA